MARNLAGADYVIGGIGSLVGIGSSAHTLLTICRRGANGSWHTPLSIETSANSSKLSLQFSNTNTIQLIIGTANKDTTVGITSSDNWVLAAVTRGSGTATPRGHKYVYDTNAWTHTDAGATTGGDSTDLTGGRIQIGRWQTTDFYNGDILLVAAWKRALTDGELENLPFTLQALIAAAPDALWLLDQHATTQSVIDLTGNGANQTSLTNTSVSTQSVPVWNYGAGPVVTIGTAAGGGPTGYTQSVSGSLTPAGALTRQAAKTLAGAATPAGALTRSTGKRPAGTLAPAGALIRTTAKQASGAITPAGSVARATAKAFAGSLTPAGALATLKAALRSFAGAIAPSGALTRQTSKTLAGSITPTGDLRRLTAKLLAGAVGVAGTVAKLTAKRLAGALAPAGTVATSTGSTPARDLQLTVGPPEPSWTARPPDGGWSAGRPAAAWTTSPPEA